MSIQLDRTLPHAENGTMSEAQLLASVGNLVKAKNDALMQDGIPAPSQGVEEKTIARNGAPDIPQPTRSSVLTSSEYAAFPALGAAFMVLITETQSQQRRLSAQQRAMETDLTCANMNEQANKIRTKAITGLVFGLVTSSLSIGQAVVTSCTMAKGMSKIAEESKLAAVNPDANANVKIDPNASVKIDPKAKADVNIEMMDIKPKIEAKVEAKVEANPKAEVEANIDAQKVNADVAAKTEARASGIDIQNQQMFLNQQIAMQNAVFSAGITSLGKVGDAIAGFMEADIKRSEINIERSRANVDALRSLEESSQAVITKALTAMEAIQSSTNQAMQRILG